MQMPDQLGPGGIADEMRASEEYARHQAEPSLIDRMTDSPYLGVRGLAIGIALTRAAAEIPRTIIEGKIHGESLRNIINHQL